jgi:WD40 repeat protein
MTTAAFDGAGDSYANITNDSRVKIWDVASGACSHE